MGFIPGQTRKPAVLIGTFPAHLTKWEEGKTYGNGIPYNTGVTFDDCKDLVGTNSKDEEFSAEHMTGKTCQGITVWFNAKTEETEQWRNQRFFEWGTTLGFKFPESKEQPDKEKISYDLCKIPEKEVWGTPVLATVILQGRTEKNGKKITLSAKNAAEYKALQDQHNFVIENIRLFPTVVAIEPREGEKLEFEEKLLAEMGKEEKAGF
jgi:hypothetical protein